MKEDLKLDSHKLIYHPCEVAKWLGGGIVYPIEIEISPSGACNHRCTFCAVDYLGYRPAFLDSDVIIKEIIDMQKQGLKSVICSGEGEPLLNKDMPDMANKIKEAGVDVAMSSNGVLLTKDVVEESLRAFTWIRFSIAAIEEGIYDAIQRGKKGDLRRVIDNISYAVEYKKNHNLQTTLGIQCLLLPENKEQIYQMAKEVKRIGVDYFTIKPYSQHTQSENQLSYEYNEMLEMEKKFGELETEQFNIYFRANAMKKMHKEKNYDNCYGLPFMTHIDAKGNVWPCVNFIGNKEFLYGNIYEQSFKEIWEGTQKKVVMEKYKEMDINKICREACRLDAINGYLHELKHPGGHVNFI